MTGFNDLKSKRVSEFCHLLAIELFRVKWKRNKKHDFDTFFLILKILKPLEI